jgi:hypothetical protein
MGNLCFMLAKQNLCNLTLALLFCLSLQMVGHIICSYSCVVLCKLLKIGRMIARFSKNVSNYNVNVFVAKLMHLSSL